MLYGSAVLITRGKVEESESSDVQIHLNKSMFTESEDRPRLVWFKSLSDTEGLNMLELHPHP